MISVTEKNRDIYDICLYLRVDQHKWSYLVDCGYAPGLQDAECKNINALFISHTHIDHFCGFDKVLRHQLGCGRTVVITGPAGIAHQVHHRLKSFTWNLVRKGAIRYEIREILSPGSYRRYTMAPPGWTLQQGEVIESGFIFEQPEFNVAYAVLDHGTPSIAYLFRERDKTNITSIPYKQGPWIRALKQAYFAGNGEASIEVEGKQIKAQSLFHALAFTPGYACGIIMDHSINPGNETTIVEFMQGIDDLYIESYFLEADRELAVRKNHSTSVASATAAGRAHVKRLHLMHHSARYSSRDIRHLHAEGQTAFATH
ncbi:MAG: peptidase [Chitinivibrionales bacterium]|nr:peptidase [Chitinivibrionales bacterium]